MVEIHALPDEEIIRYYKQTQDMECLGILYKRYSHLVLGVCIKVLKDNQLALDLTMHIFEVLATRLKHNSVNNFNSWIYSLCKNECLSRIRKQKIEKKYITGWSEDIDAIIPVEPVFEYKQNGEIGKEELMIAIDKLSEIQATCIKLFFLGEKSYKEIALSTGLTETLVKSHLQNGKRNLKLFLC